MTPISSILERQLLGQTQEVSPPEPQGGPLRITVVGPPMVSQSRAQILVALPGKELFQERGVLEQVLQSNFLFLRRKLTVSPPHVQQAVTIDSRIMHGNPVFAGTRIPLYQILEELADGTTLGELVEGYPSLSLEKIQASLDYLSSLLRVHDD